MNLRARLFATGVGGAIALLWTAVAAHADAIDGDWCLGAKSMSIHGPDIVTPGGRRIKGDYTRHSFSYKVPAGEPGAGEVVAMILQSEYLLHARQGDDKAPLQEWRRCAAKTS